MDHLTIAMLRQQNADLLAALKALLPENQNAAVSGPETLAQARDAAAKAEAPENAGLDWLRVDGDYLFVSRCDWIYPQATQEDSGPRDEARCKAIGHRDGDMVLPFRGALLDAQDLATMLTYSPFSKA
ncbi:hypothetical protein ACO0LM_11930 [Undibacterium sp. Di26W]|uniref:hypothetical protein n=1 Tax=Undibacterium sp. Di26W TaxID=3413035 RepID=UPI003BF42209